MATLTRNDLATKLRDKFGFTASQSAKLVDLVFDEVGTALINGEEVKFAGFGTFKVKNKAARKGINPQTKQVITIPATKAPSFKFGKSFKELLK